MQDTNDLLEDERARRAPSPLPWVLLAIAVVAGATSSVVLLRRVAAVRADAREVALRMQEEQRVTSASLALARETTAALESKVARLERESSELQVRESELAASLLVKEDELARLEAAAAREKMKAANGKGARRGVTSGHAVSSRAAAGQAKPVRRAGGKLARAKAAPAKRATTP